MDMINSQLVPPGFRFYPTDEELVGYYLKKKVESKRIDLNVIKDVDLYKIEPWDLQELCQISAEEQTEWHFFSHKDKKYPTGTRTNRATKTGFWKATGRDKPIFLKHNLIGMRKTLVYYVGRAPNGQKTDWIMHEYRLETNEYGIPQEEGWVVCKAFKKRVPALRKHDQHADPSQYLFDDKLFNLIPEFDLHSSKPNNDNYTFIDDNPFERENIVDQMLSSDVTDWRELDKFVASQLSHDDPHFSNASASAINLAMNM